MTAIIHILPGPFISSILIHSLYNFCLLPVPIKQLPIRFIFLFALICMFCVACKQSVPPLKVEVGKPFPVLNVKDLYGKDVTLSTVTNKTIILNVWATWCGPCRHEMPSLDRLNNVLDSNKFEVIGLSVDNDDHIVREFLIERKVGFVNYMDPSMLGVNNIIGIRAFPSTFIISGDGILQDVIEGWKEWDSEEIIISLNKGRT